MSYKSKIISAIEKNDIIHKKLKKSLLDSKAINIVEKFIIDNKLICYGGTAINSILPESKKIYDYSLDIPDYDFFSPTPLIHAKKLARIYAENGFENIESKSALFKGTYKVFVNFVPVADITLVEEYIYEKLKSKSLEINKMLFVSTDFLKMSLYQELSRPLGDISRWEKIYNRLTILQEYLKEDILISLQLYKIPNNKINKSIYNKLKNICINNKVVLFGDFGLSFYLKYFPSHIKNIINKCKIKQMFILSETIEDITELLKDIKYDIILHKNTGKFSNDIYEIIINGFSFIYVFITTSCQSFNIIRKNNNIYNIATIDTIISNYYSLEYSNIKNIDITNIKSYCYLLENIHSNNKNNILKRFYIPCIGHQETVADIKNNRNQVYKKYKNNKTHKKYLELFFKYYPKTKKNIKTL